MPEQQPGWFDDDGEKIVVRCPICCYIKHCGSKAELDEPQDTGECINTNLRCLKCGARGVISERKDLL